MIQKDHIITIFGGTGDLTYRKLLPAIFNLYVQDTLPKSLPIVIIGRRDFDSDSYRKQMVSWISEHSRFKTSEDKIKDFLKQVHYFKMTFTEDEGYKRLYDYFNKLDKKANTLHDRLYYFAVDPLYFIDIAKKLEANNLVNNSQIIIEKPFGKDLASALEINDALQMIFKDSDIYRIDHYIGKEMVQNIHTIRFTNALFKNIWNKDTIESIQISAAEEIGVGNRGRFYDVTGAIKDMFQNHLLQILSMITMNKPKNDEAHSIHKEQEAILEKLFIRNHETDIIYGQYDDYKNEVDVLDDSNTETFAALRLEIDNERWKGVPIFVRTGKKMHKRATEITIQLKGVDDYPGNVLVIKVQPDEGIYLKVNIKKPGHSFDLETVFMDYCQSCNLEYRNNTPEAYERLLDAAMDKDQTLFASMKQVKLSWELTEKILELGKNNPIFTYPCGSAGPKASIELLKKENTAWFEEQVYGELFEKNIESN